MLCDLKVLRTVTVCIEVLIHAGFSTELQSCTWLTESCLNRSTSAPDSTQTSSGAVTSDGSMTQLFDRCPVTPPFKKEKKEQDFIVQRAAL